VLADIYVTKRLSKSAVAEDLISICKMVTTPTTLGIVSE